MKHSSHSGFTLVEIMVVIIIIGLLAAIAVPNYLKIRTNSQAANLANDFRVYAHAFEIFALEYGYWPADSTPGVIPAGMEGRLPKFDQPSIVGGNWDWEYEASGVTAGISLRNSNASDALLQRLADQLGDGNLSTGKLRKASHGAANDVTYVIIE